MGQFSGHTTRTLWFRIYRQRMKEGLEPCRNCLTEKAQTFDHIVPVSSGGRSSISNVTVLCDPCNTKKSDQEWNHLISLLQEEYEAEPDRRWYLSARSPKEGPVIVYPKTIELDIDVAKARLRKRLGR